MMPEDTPTAPPRVQITYPVLTLEEEQQRELPFVVGVLAGLSGMSDPPLAPLSERKFVHVDRDSFQAVLAWLQPHLVLSVPNLPGQDEACLSVELRFRGLTDFEPEGVLRQIESLHESRQRSGSDELISRQLNEILNCAEFQNLESAWRSLFYVLSQTPPDAKVKIYFLNAGKQELLDDFRRSPRLEDSALFRKACTEMFACIGAEPFGVLIGDYAFGPGPDDVELLEKLAQVAAAAQAPLLTAPAPEMFGCRRFGELAGTYDFESLIPGANYRRWRSFRERREAGFVVMAMPRVRLRLPFSAQGGADLWGNAVYSLAACLIRAFAAHGWCARIRGVESGGMVTDLPVPITQDEHGVTRTGCPLELALDEKQEKRLSDLGFNCLLHWIGTRHAVFFSSVTCAEVRRSPDREEDIAALLGVRLPYVLAVTRFVHHLKVIARDSIPESAGREEVETFLNSWMSRYVSDEDCPDEVEAAYLPLREAHLRIEDAAGAAGARRAFIALRPQFQLEDPGAPIRLEFDLPRGLPGFTWRITD